MDLKKLKDSQYNRIIDLTFETASHKFRKIVCPRRGRKPKIEINGTYSCKDYLPTFNVTINNLYLDVQGEQYSKLTVNAGYEGNVIEFTGSILTMYQEQPGPEGRTIVQCQFGNVKDWLDANVQLNYPAGTSLIQILEAIKPKIGATQVMPGSPIEAAKLSLKEPFEFDGKARQAFIELENRFQTKNLAIFMRNKLLCAICLATKDFVGIQELKYISAPPQENTGNTAGTYYTTVTAPWMPDLQIGDMLTIPSRVYIRNFQVVGGLAKTQNIQVTALSFHFGTTGGTNQMTVQGFLVR